MRKKLIVYKLCSNAGQSKKSATGQRNIPLTLLQVL